MSRIEPGYDVVVVGARAEAGASPPRACPARVTRLRTLQA